MLIDVNAYIGHYPFRIFKYRTAVDLIKQMDKYGIDKSCVSSLNAVYYTDCMDGNYELLDEIAPYSDRLIPFCVINPEYNEAINDFLLCVDNLGFKGLRLFPRQQHYDLSGEASVELLKTAGEKNIPVHIPILLQDLRGCHPMENPKQISAEEIKDAALAAPYTNIILSNAYLSHYSYIIEPACKEHPGMIYYDIGRLDCLQFPDGIATVAENAGYDHILFGTGALLQNIPVQLVKLHYMNKLGTVSPEQLEGIKNKNISRIVSLK